MATPRPRWSGRKQQLEALQTGADDFLQKPIDDAELQLEAEIERSQRAQSTTTLAMLDIDHFKRVNDSYGHPVGDRVIRSLSELLRRRLRKSDVIGRYGGEEFVVLMPDTGMDNALAVIDGLRQDFASLRYLGEHDTFECTFSAGIAQLPPEMGMDELIGAADAALYEAKRGGRNCVRCAKARL